MNFVRVIRRAKSRGVKADGNRVQEDTALLLNPACIKAIRPFWGVRKDGTYFDCSPSMKGAEVPFCWLEDMEGVEYILLRSDWHACLDDEQVGKLTGEQPPPVPPFGFAAGRNG